MLDGQTTQLDMGGGVPCSRVELGHDGTALRLTREEARMSYLLAKFTGPR